MDDMVVVGGRDEFELDLPTEQWQHVATWLHGRGEPTAAVRLLASIAAHRTRGELTARLPLPALQRPGLIVWLHKQGLRLALAADRVAWCIKGIEPPPTQALSYLAVLVRGPEDADAAAQREATRNYPWPDGAKPVTSEQQHLEACIQRLGSEYDGGSGRQRGDHDRAVLQGAIEELEAERAAAAAVAADPPPRKSVKLDMGVPVTRLRIPEEGLVDGQHRPPWEDATIHDHAARMAQQARRRLARMPPAHVDALVWEAGAIVRQGRWRRWLRRGWRAVFGRGR